MVFSDIVFCENYNWNLVAHSLPSSEPFHTSSEKVAYTSCILERRQGEPKVTQQQGGLEAAQN